MANDKERDVIQKIVDFGDNRNLMVLAVLKLTGAETENQSTLKVEGESRQFSLNNPLNHVIINYSMSVLSTIKQAMSADLVDEAGSTA